MPAYKKESTGKWYVSFYYQDWTGKRIKKKKEGFKTKKEAQEFEREFLNKSKTNINIIFKNLVEEYLLDAKVRVRPTTLSNKNYIIKLRILPYFEELEISSITPKM